MNKCKLFLVPYAGASSYLYYPWKEKLGENFAPIFVELAGRGLRNDEPFYETLSEAATDIARIIMKEVSDGSDYICFGHSLGSLILFEVYYKLLEDGYKLPKNLYFSGRDAPHVNHFKEKVYLYDDSVFLDFVSSYGGLPKAFERKEIQDVFLPILRADFKILCNYEILLNRDKIKSDTTIFYGREDFSMTPSSVEEWNVHALNKCRIKAFDGDHFFINNAFPEIMGIMAENINN